MSTEPRRTFYAETRPTIMCLYGSSRSYDEFQQANHDLTMAAGPCSPSASTRTPRLSTGTMRAWGHDLDEKIALDELHKRKIDLADYFYVLDVDGYVGESTKSEIAYASRYGVPVRNLSQEQSGRG